MIWLCSFYEYKIQVFMSKFKIPGVSFSLSRALGITQVKQKFARHCLVGFGKLQVFFQVGGECE